MFCIFDIGGKQYKVSEGDVVFLEKLNAQEGDTVKFEKVLAVSDNEGFVTGNPTVKGASVEATVLKNGKAKKITIIRYKAKKNEKRKQGHRQPYTKVQIAKITK